MLFGIEPTIAGIRLLQAQGLPHRLEIVGSSNLDTPSSLHEKNDNKGHNSKDYNQSITWYNDSIATTPEATAAALAAIPTPVILILTGRDKGGNYRLLTQAISQHQHCRVFIWRDIPASCRQALMRQL